MQITARAGAGTGCPGAQGGLVSWFASQKLSERTYLLAEPPYVNSYLILGSRRAVLSTPAWGSPGSDASQNAG